MTPLAEQALLIAQEEVGVQEVPLGSNAGPRVLEYLASVGIHGPASWCASFMYWCFLQASMILKVKTPLFRTGGVLNQWGMSKPNQVHTPAPGDLFILDEGHGLGHMGIIESIDAKGVLHTIEGNSNNNGSRNGVAVVRHFRFVTDPHLKGYLRF